MCVVWATLHAYAGHLLASNPVYIQPVGVLV